MPQGDLRQPGFLQLFVPISFPHREKGTETFRASIVIPSKDKAVFLLSYEELLQRRLGKYEHVISVRPQQLVGRLTVEVNILESSGITSLEVLPLHNSRQKGSGRAEGEWCLLGTLRYSWVTQSWALALEQFIKQMALLRQRL